MLDLRFIEYGTWNHEQKNTKGVTMNTFSNTFSNHTRSTFQQCKMKRGDKIHTAWIPSKYAKQGEYIKIREKGEWIDGYCVEEVGSIKMREDFIKERSQDYKRTRQASDISRNPYREKIMK